MYRLHPKHRKNGIKNSPFLEEFADFLSKHIILPGKLLIVGDFNIHCNTPTDRNSRTLNDIIESFKLKQHVGGSTHINGNMLDLLISRENEDFIRNVTITDIISDHVIVEIKLAITKPGLPKKKITYRKYRAIDITQLRTDIMASDLVVTPHSTLENQADQYNMGLPT